MTSARSFYTTKTHSGSQSSLRQRFEYPAHFRCTVSTRYLRNESAEIYFQMPIVLSASPHSSVQARGVPDDQ